MIASAQIVERMKPHRTLDCPTCGVELVDLDSHEWDSENGNPLDEHHKCCWCDTRWTLSVKGDKPWRGSDAEFELDDLAVRPLGPYPVESSWRAPGRGMLEWLPGAAIAPSYASAYEARGGYINVSVR